MGPKRKGQGSKPKRNSKRCSRSPARKRGKKPSKKRSPTPKKKNEKASSKPRRGPRPPSPLPVDVKDLGPVIRSPIDTKLYKALQLRNGMKVVLISRCGHQLDLDGCCNSRDLSECKYEKIREFNNDVLGIEAHEITDTGGSCCGGGSEPKEPCCSGPNCSILTDEEIKSRINVQQSLDPDVLHCCGSTASVCVTVCSGSFHDPPDIPGMAHFNEHCVFLGSEKYPAPMHLFDIATKHGAIVNAMTQSESTSYFVSSEAKSFDVILDVFSNMIQSPTFPEAAIIKEIEAVDSEFLWKKVDPGARVTDFFGYLAKPCHPMGKFTWGNKKSLLVPNIRKRMVEWHQEHYGANYMTLCIQAPFPIRELQKMAIKYFSAVPSNSLPDPRQRLLRFGEPFEPDHFSKIYHIVPVAKIRWLVVTWCMPPSVWKNYLTNPLLYIQVVMNSEAKGGLIAYLVDKKWVTEVGSSHTLHDNFYRNAYCAAYRFFVCLTVEGLRNRDQVVLATQSYIRMLIEKGAQERIFEEVKRTQANHFHYSDFEDELQSTQEISMAMQDADLKHVLTSKTLVSHFCKGSIDAVLRLLDLRHANILFVAREFANGKEFKKFHHVMSDRFVFRPIDKSEEHVEMLETVPVMKEFWLPEPNTFLSEEIGSHHETVEFIQFKSDEDYMTLYESNEKGIRLTMQNAFIVPCYSKRLPSASFLVTFISPRNSLANSSLLGIWAALLSVFMGRELNLAHQTLEQHLVLHEPDGISLKVDGPSFHLTQVLLAQLHIWERFADFMSEEMYNGHRLEIIECHENDLLYVKKFAEDLLNFTLKQEEITLFQKIHKLQETEYSDFMRFVRSYKSSMFVDVEVFGSVAQHQIEEVKDAILKTKYKPHRRRQKQVERTSKLPLGCKTLRVRLPNAAVNSSLLVSHYQFGSLTDPEQIRMLNLIERVLSATTFIRLRTQDQLGYSVKVHKWEHGGCYGLTFTVLTHPDKFTTEYVNCRLEIFIQDFFDINFQSDKAFQRLACPHSKKKPFNFKDARSMFRNYLIPEGFHYRKLSVQLVGYKKNTTKAVNKLTKQGDRVINLEYQLPPGMAGIGEAAKDYIMDLRHFKRTMELYPNMSTV